MSADTEGAVPVIAPVAVAREYPDGKLPLVTAYSIVSLPSVAVTWNDVVPPSSTVPKLPN